MSKSRNAAKAAATLASAALAAGAVQSSGGTAEGSAAPSDLASLAKSDGVAVTADAAALAQAEAEAAAAAQAEADAASREAAQAEFARAEAAAKRAELVFPLELVLRNNSSIPVSEPATHAFLSCGGSFSVTVHDAEQLAAIRSNFDAIAALNYFEPEKLVIDGLPG